LSPAAADPRKLQPRINKLVRLIGYSSLIHDTETAPSIPHWFAYAAQVKFAGGVSFFVMALRILLKVRSA
jgi:hypothetical protein